MSGGSLTLHATCVAVAGKGILITGPSGSGKSSLALHLIALGAQLVSDDRTIVSRDAGRLVARPPLTIAGMIEARGVGILQTDYLEAVPLMVAIDMAMTETARLPDPHVMDVLDINIPCLHKVDAAYFPAAIHTYISGIQKESS